MVPAGGLNHERECTVTSRELRCKLEDMRQHLAKVSRYLQNREDRACQDKHELSEVRAALTKCEKLGWLLAALEEVTLEGRP